ncbi:MAG: HPr-rel-A system PqqD family peptide chaperone [Methylovulum sp.]|uniref:HPr-rel-A system PqqD family peptide chaperone n=1 Tax=Methylovulum sp. TaxID=1916980 RepID=UPI00262061F8|nr:HPr-rel-A system PqqD family peptide chaperone [Methylovulum sp.]MDD2724780.1 HPr-rel-A system PqqD family peptide chaperone [Methylovulum sp.]MDD5126004.1 HPr-rel-A system PqqD family peptide chaperone [Methylovulum sp.]
MFKNYTVALPKNAGISCYFASDECVVYHELSGKTHLLDEMGGFLYKAILEHCLTRPQLLAHCVATFELPVDFDLEAYLDKLIFDYENLGLIEVMENY